MITQRVGGRHIQTIDARKLHAFLEISWDFSTWIKGKINEYEFIEGKDYTIFLPRRENPLRGRPAKEYHISTSMAREISMTVSTPKGKEARLYFIRCEEELFNILNMDELEIAERYIVSIKEKRAFKVMIDNNVLFPRVEIDNEASDHISLKDIKMMFAPYLAVNKLNIILAYYGHGKTLFALPVDPDTKIPVFKREGIQTVLDRFYAEANIRKSEKGWVLSHECLLGQTIRINQRWNVFEEGPATDILARTERTEEPVGS